jgi:DNA-binding response OmpR family regulator
VDDDVATREMFRMALRIAGFDVETASDGVAALRHIEQHVPDVVVLDLDLPGINGIAVHGELGSRDRTRNVPIVIVTGTDWQLPSPVSAALAKPLTPHELVDAVRDAASGRTSGARSAAADTRTVVWLCPRCHRVVREGAEPAETAAPEMRVGATLCAACASGTPPVIN